MNKPKVFICDDDEGIIDVVKIVLEDKGCEVHLCPNSELFFDCVEKIKPDIIFLDLWMPGIGGKEIAQILKADKNMKNIPVVIMSANKDAKGIADEVGADELLTKPFNIADLENVVDKYC